MSAIAERYREVRRRICDAADVVGRDPSEVTVVAVTKTVGVAEIRAASAAGVEDFGENRVQEFLGKYGLFPDLRWHFIGTLQSNKVRGVVGRTALIHSVDSIRLLEVIDSVAKENGVSQPVLLQVNVSGEQTKHGFRVDDLEEVLTSAVGLHNVRVKGLMTIAPFVRGEEVRWLFRELAQARERLVALRLNGVELDELSMGMTNDYEVAVEEGATIVRLGAAIFGRHQ